MDVFLVPVGPDRHELYCEVPVDSAMTDAGGGRPTSWWRRQVASFRQLLSEAEEESRRRERGETVESRGIWRWFMRQVAESLAEQRLLWHLRTERAVRLVHPQDVAESHSLQVARDSLRRDYDKHSRWFAIDALLWLACLPLTLIPGPNVAAIYFAFRAVGHFFSMRGARQGLTGVAWTMKPSSELSELRKALALGGRDRRASIDRVAAVLGLDRLGAFVDRVAS